MTTRILATVALERVRQHIKHGDQRHLSDGTGPLWTATADVARRDCDRALADGTLTYRHILAEEVAEVYAESDPDRLRAELIQVAAVCVQWIEAIDGRSA